MIINGLASDDVTVKARFYVNPAGDDGDDKKDQDLKSQLLPADRNGVVYVARGSRQTMRVTLLAGDCMELTTSSSRDNDRSVLIGGKSSHVVCGKDKRVVKENKNNLVLSRDGKFI